MTGSLLLTITLMGAAAGPHCASMCAGMCRLIVGPVEPGRRAARWGLWLTGRVAGYAAGGAAAAGLGGTLQWLSQSQSWARPVWLMLQAATLLLGLTLLWRGRMPPALERWLHSLGRPPQLEPSAGVVQVVRWKSDLKLAGSGAMWVALPCGVLQAAWVVAALASTLAEGAAAMALFAMASAPGLVFGQILWRKVLRRHSKSPADGHAPLPDTTLPLRIAGAGIALMSGSGVIMAAWHPLQAAWCA
jgi:sulfite exporter TauE/SafE